jgi:hypothetical protein
MLSLFIAILPLALAAATGTRLQYSLRWGLSFLTAASETEEEEIEGEETEETEGEETEGEKTEGEETAAAETGETESSESDTPIETITPPKPSLLVRIQRFYQSFTNTVQFVVQTQIFLSYREKLVPPIYWSLIILSIIGLLLTLFRRRDYGLLLISVVIFEGILLFLMTCRYLNLPEIMPIERTLVYCCFMLIVLWGMAIDSICALLLDFFKHKWMMHSVSFLCLCAIMVFVYQNKLIRQRYVNSNIWQTNSALTCMTNIIHDNQDYNWTICSANDETHMIYGHGFHVETIDFLTEMESDGYNAPIPSEKVYFFIEKIPLNYGGWYNESGQSVSYEGAKRRLPEKSGLAPYVGENRWIVMSKMYYWAQEFMRRFPESFTVYYETENFVCYEAQQNISRVYNFAVDY